MTKDRDESPLSSKLDPSGREDDFAILTPPWVVILLMLYLVSGAALIAWVSHDKTQISINLSRMSEQLADFSEDRYSQQNEQSETLAQVGLTLKAFDIANARLGRQLSAVANALDKQIMINQNQGELLSQLNASLVLQAAAFQTWQNNTLNTLTPLRSLVSDTSKGVISLQIKSSGLKQNLLKNQKTIEELTKQNAKVLSEFKQIQEKITLLEQQQNQEVLGPIVKFPVDE